MIQQADKLEDVEARAANIGGFAPSGEGIGRAPQSFVRADHGDHCGLRDCWKRDC